MAISIEAKIEIAIQSCQQFIHLVRLDKLEETKYQDGIHNHYKYRVVLGNRQRKVIVLTLDSNDSHSFIRELIHAQAEKRLGEE